MEKQEAFGLSTLGQIAITVSDLDKSRAFYGQALGLKPMFAMQHMAFFDCGGVRLMISTPEADFKAGGQPGTVFYFKVASAREAEAQLTARGVRFEKPAHLLAKMGSYDLWMAFFRDPDGQPLALMSEE
ncbi:MAG: Glyoxalase/bleomycin resistance protein/dioxygenase [Fibrobacteres bacterium]|nr:Glyoxalase/bleomycin resistance protein/dioxygenase [Fibrobacterota bacterium]